MAGAGGVAHVSCAPPTRGWPDTVGVMVDRDPIGADPASSWRQAAEKRKAAERAMNRFERLFGFRGEAKVKYLDGEFQVVSPGDYVLCAVTGEPIPLAELKYWSVALQEAYATAEASLTRHLETRRPADAG
jgi:hypothetical protein